MSQNLSWFTWAQIHLLGGFEELCEMTAGPSGMESEAGAVPPGSLGMHILRQLLLHHLAGHSMCFCVRLTAGVKGHERPWPCIHLSLPLPLPVFLILGSMLDSLANCTPKLLRPESALALTRPSQVIQVLLLAFHCGT